jgi:hypothetical protein
MTFADYEDGFACGEHDAFALKRGGPPNEHYAVHPDFAQGYRDGFTPRSAAWVGEPIKPARETTGEMR